MAGFLLLAHVSDILFIMQKLRYYFDFFWFTTQTEAVSS